MIYRRQEGFRFKFDQPLPGHISDSTFLKESILIYDLSLNGMKFSSPHELKIQDALYQFEFELNEYLFEPFGKIVWNKKNINTVMYGVLFQNDSYSKETLLKEIKICARLRHMKK